MTQLDLPPISIARYFDLLKRRRWQVVPVTILGLAIGALVAFFIPRYYVATAKIEIRGSMLAQPENKDPMAAVVDTAQVQIPQAVEDAVQKLGWPEALISDPTERRAALAAIRDRVTVVDLNAERDRAAAVFSIQYKDTDVDRAESLADALRRTWIESRQDQLLAQTKSRANQLQEEIRQKNTAKDTNAKNIAAFEKAHHIDPQDSPLPGQESPRTKALNEAQAKVDELTADVVRLEAQLKVNKDELAVEPVTKTVQTPESLAPELKGQIQAYQLLLQRAEAKVQGATAANPYLPMYQLQRDTLKASLESAMSLVTEAGQQVVDNPRHVKLQETVTSLEADLGAARKNLEIATANRDELKKVREASPDVWIQYAALRSDADLLESDMKDLLARNTDLLERKREIERGDWYELVGNAWAPPAATEPNITLVALAGMAVGLAVAVGLILLIDVLTSTYKTVSDVERLLPVPVLGGLSHMTTIEERRQATSRRLRAGLLAGAFLVLTLSLVTIYYVAPTRLPPVVRNALDVLLGPSVTQSQ